MFGHELRLSMFKYLNFLFLQLESIYHNTHFHKGLHLVNTKAIKISFLSHDSSTICTVVRSFIQKFLWSFAEKTFVKKSIMLEWEKFAQNGLLYTESALRGVKQIYGKM